MGGRPGSVYKLEATLRRAAGLPVTIVGATSGYLDPAPKALARPMLGDYSNTRAEDEGGGAPVGELVDEGRNMYDTFCVDRESPW